MTNPKGDPASEREATSAPAAVGRTFWAVVVLVNIAVLGLSVGVLLLLVPGQTEAGLGTAAVGGLAGVAAYYRYRRFKHSR